MGIDDISKWQALAALPSALYTAAQVRALDQCAITAGTAGSLLMLRAARVVFEQMLKRWPNTALVFVFCGKGNNGGDGFLVAKLAAERGLSTYVVELAGGSNNHASQFADATAARKQMLAAGVVPVAEQDFDYELLKRCDTASTVVVDAMLGTGLTGVPRAAYKQAILAVNQALLPTLAVDIPSGVCSDSGCVVNDVAVRADLTVTFIGLKQGLFTADAVNYVGELVFSDLDVGQNTASEIAAVELSKLAKLAVAIPARAANAYKNQSGHVLVVGGDYGMSGAPLLSASAALLCGAGLVSVATRPEHIAGMITRQPELMVRGVSRDNELLAMLKRATVLVVGPGLGQSEWSQQLLKICLDYASSRGDIQPLPVVIDADGLNLIAQQPQLLAAKITAVLTPHTGEARRLLDAHHLSYDHTDRFAVMRLLCEHYQQVTVLKGAGTLVADTHTNFLCPYGNPALATAGTGDVLSGVIGSMLAQGFAPIEAAELGVVAHAAAADYRVFTQGPIGFVASELVLALPRLLNELLFKQSFSG